MTYAQTEEQVKTSLKSYVTTVVNIFKKSEMCGFFLFIQRMICQDLYLIFYPENTSGCVHSLTHMSHVAGPLQ